MRAFLPLASTESMALVSAKSAGELAMTLETLKLHRDQIDEIVAQWEVIRADLEWASLLGACLTMLEIDRGFFDAPLPIWPDLDDAGASGRLFYFYVFALDYPRAVEFLERVGTPANVIDATMDVLARRGHPRVQVGHARRRRGLVDAACLAWGDPPDWGPQVSPVDVGRGRCRPNRG